MEGQSSLMNGLVWIGGGVISLLSLIGVGSIILAVLKRFWDRRDKRDETVDATKAIQIEADKTIVEKMFDRLAEKEAEWSAKIEKLEAKVEKLEEALDSQRDMNIRKDEQIKTLTTENERLRNRVQDQGKEIEGLKKEIEHLKEQLRAIGVKPTLVNVSGKQ